MMYADCRCGQEVKAADHVAGTLRKCPACGMKVQFPHNPDDARRTPVTNKATSALPLGAVGSKQAEQLPAISAKARSDEKQSVAISRTFTDNDSDGNVWKLNAFKLSSYRIAFPRLLDASKYAFGHSIEAIAAHYRKRKHRFHLAADPAKLAVVSLLLAGIAYVMGRAFHHPSTGDEWSSIEGFFYILALMIALFGGYFGLLQAVTALVSGRYMSIMENETFYCPHCRCRLDKVPGLGEQGECPKCHTTYIG